MEPERSKGRSGVKNRQWVHPVRNSNEVIHNAQDEISASYSSNNINQTYLNPYATIFDPNAIRYNNINIPFNNLNTNLVNSNINNN